MEYKGPLYGKVGRTYFPLQETSEDFDKLKSDFKELYEKSKAIIDLHTAEIEGLLSGQPSKEEWQIATMELSSLIYQ